MRFNLLPIVVMACAFATLASPAQAEYTLNAGARLSQDNNVNGSPDTPNKASQRSDNYLSLNASAVYFTPLDDAKTRYFIGQAGAMSANYNTFSNLDSTAVMVGGGFYQQLTPTWSGQLMGRGYSRNTRQSERNSNGYGGTLEIKKQFTQSVWVKAVADYEDSAAQLGAFSYTGKTWGVNLGYLPLENTFANLGYSHNYRDFKTTAPFTPDTQTLFIELSQRLTKNWYLNGGYATMKNDSNYAGTAYTNRVLSLGVSCSY